LQDWMDFIMLLSGSIICMSENSFPSITLLNLGKNSYLLTMAYNSVYQRNMYSNHKKKVTIITVHHNVAPQCSPLVTESACHIITAQLWWTSIRKTFI
jgi:hypothetical protein